MNAECEKWVDDLFEPDEALSASQVADLNAHLATCPNCAHERELFLLSWSALDKVEDELEPSPLIRAKVWEVIRQERCPCAPPDRLLPQTGFKLSSARIAPRWAGLAVAAAFVISFGCLRTFAPQTRSPLAQDAHRTATPEPELDPELIKLASQDGFSIEVFPPSAPSLPPPSPSSQATPSIEEPTPESWPSLAPPNHSGSVRYVSQDLYVPYLEPR